MNNTPWTYKYFEKTHHEFHSKVFNSLEIEKYLKQSLKKKGFCLHDYKLNISNTNIAFFLSIYEKPKNMNTHLKKKKFKIYRKVFCKNSFKSLSQFMGNKYNLIFKIRVINEKFFKKTANKALLNNSFTFRIETMQRLYLVLTTQKNSTELLGTFIAEQLKMTKRHNFFINLLVIFLNKIIDQKYSKIKGIKILLKGRLNNAPRSRKKTIKVGTIPIITQNTKIVYSETISFTSNGTIGIKVWTNQ